MAFAKELAAKIDQWEQSDEYHLIEEFWLDFASTKEATVGNYTMVLLKSDGGPGGDYDGRDFEFAFTVDGDTYVAHVDYDSYEFSGNQYSLFTAEPYEFTETRYRTVARAR